MFPDLRVTTGIIGSVVCLLLYAAPILTFKRVIKKGSVEEYSCIPYILTLFSSLTYTWYGLPVVSSGWENLTLSGISSLGVLFESTFISIYIWFAPRGKKKLVMAMVSSIVIIFGMAVFFSSFSIHTHQMRKVFVGSIGLVASILMYGSPLVAVAPSCIGCLMGILQLVVYCMYNKCKESPKTNPDIEQADVVKVTTSQDDTKGQKPLSES
ncbi:hypothetical protein BRADI_2g32230v3 [Brachypodium distachyon]|uniref:Bidirectional sugar transporter SWEET n=1 Tax=Brachypodium distachyon TaxID=15368 RepID=A0A2K2DBF1_BRADI|nr:hypothetical protein BRADI_2g32230v3 [Brachypodium distachyon]